MISFFFNKKGKRKEEKEEKNVGKVYKKSRIQMNKELSLIGYHFRRSNE
jgi:hypothetical protein